MIRKGSLVKYIGPDTKEIYNGKYMSVAERKGDNIEVYKRDKKGDWSTVVVDVKMLEEVC